MSKSSLFFRTVIFLALTAVCCQESTIREGGQPGKEAIFWNDAARYLAGLPVGPQSSFYRAAADPGYATHVALMDRFWEKVNRTENENIRAFQREHLKKAPDSVVYPLSGADFGNLYHLFPNAREYLMIATERPGRVLHPDNFRPEERIASLGAIRMVISSIAQYNYLYSAYMRRYMDGYYVYGGTLPVVLIMMARMGHTPLKVEDVVINENGRIEPGVTGSIQGYRIEFRADGRVRELIYLPIWLSNEAVDPSTPSGKFLASRKGGALMLKAAVYLLHWPKYDTLRQHFLNSSELIVQDDSGIPFRDLTAFNVELFGNYIRPVPIGLVGYHPQPDLALAYRQRSQPISFHYGYGARVGTHYSNLQVARRK